MFIQFMSTHSILWFVKMHFEGYFEYIFFSEFNFNHTSIHIDENVFALLAQNWLDTIGRGEHIFDLKFDGYYLRIFTFGIAKDLANEKNRINFERKRKKTNCVRTLYCVCVFEREKERACSIIVIKSSALFEPLGTVFHVVSVCILYGYRIVKILLRFYCSIMFLLSK